MEVLKRHGNIQWLHFGLHRPFTPSPELASELRPYCQAKLHTLDREMRPRPLMCGPHSNEHLIFGNATAVRTAPPASFDFLRH